MSIYTLQYLRLRHEAVERRDGVHGALKEVDLIVDPVLVPVDEVAAYELRLIVNSPL